MQTQKTDPSRQELTFDPREFAEFREALLEAFPDRASLRHMLQVRVGVNLERIASEADLEETVSQVLRWAEKKGKFGTLLESASAENPENPRLRAFVESIKTRAPTADRPAWALAKRKRWWPGIVATVLILGGGGGLAWKLLNRGGTPPVTRTVPAPPGEARSAEGVDVVLLYALAPSNGAPEENVARKVEHLLSDTTDDSVRVVAVEQAWAPEIEREWAAQGINPYVSVYGSYTRHNVEGTLKVAAPSVSVSFSKGGDLMEELQPGGRALSSFIVPTAPAIPVSVVFEQTAQAKGLLQDFPTDMAAYVSLLLGIKRLAGKEPDKATAWFERSTRLATWPNRHRDRALRSVLHTASLLQMKTPDHPAAIRTLAAALAARRDDSAGEDVLLRGKVGASLDELIFLTVVQMASSVGPSLVQILDDETVTAEKIEDALTKKFGGPEWKSIAQYYYEHFDMTVRLTDRHAEDQLRQIDGDLMTTLDNTEQTHLCVAALKARSDWIRTGQDRAYASYLEAEIACIDAEETSSADSGAISASRERAARLRKLSSAAQDVSALLDDARLQLASYHRRGHIRCGERLVIQGVLGKGGRVVIPAWVVKRISEAYSTCQHCLEGQKKYMLELVRVLDCPK